jgi:glycosyltransferase involved in cell wall biosynthesis
MASVDVAIPCYQHGRYLRDCVESVLSQGIDDVRVLVIDNASTDDSVAIARQLASEDSRVEVVAHEKNLGPHASFNEGVDRASADYFMVLCADDLLTPQSLQRAVAVMEEHPEVSFAYGTDVHWHMQNPRPDMSGAGAAEWRIQSGTDFIRERCRNPERYIAAGMVLVRTSVQKAAGHYRPELPHTDDFEMLLRLACLGRVAFTPAVQGIKRMHGKNRTEDFLAERTRDLVERIAAFDSFFAREGRTLPNARRLKRLGRRSISERAYWCGMKDLLRGRRSAAELLKLAVRLDPSVALVPPLNYLLRLRLVYRDNPAVV